MAAMSSLGVALGICSFTAAPSEKIGRTRSVQIGAIAGAVPSLIAFKIAATNVPWMHAALPVQNTQLESLG
jgi:hypothetical protein